MVGGGPAGLAAAIHAAHSGARVVLFERNDQCGVKLLATGGGHCNLANIRPLDEWPGLFGKRGRFIRPALARMPLETLLSWFSAMGEPAICKDGFHYFPLSTSARSVRDALVREADRLGVDIRTGKRVERLFADSGAVTGLAVAGEAIACDAVVLACGGKSRPATGSTWDGCLLAASVGHRIASPFPGLVGLRAENLSADLAGLVLPDAEVIFKTKGTPTITKRGELLLTHEGVSGPAILDMSATVAEALGGTRSAVPLLVRWCAGETQECWTARMHEWRAHRGGMLLSSLLREHLPQRLARWICGSAGADERTTAASLRSAPRDRLSLLLGAYPLSIKDTEGWDKAMITRGGVDVREVDAGALRSRIVDGLFFSGEMLDMDGPCGGYNLHWAFASGALAGDSAAAS